MLALPSIIVIMTIVYSVTDSIVKGNIIALYQYVYVHAKRQTSRDQHHF